MDTRRSIIRWHTCFWNRVGLYENTQLWRWWNRVYSFCVVSLNSHVFINMGNEVNTYRTDLARFSTWWINENVAQKAFVLGMWGWEVYYIPLSYDWWNSNRGRLGQSIMVRKTKCVYHMYHVQKTIANNWKCFQTQNPAEYNTF